MDGKGWEDCTIDLSEYRRVKNDLSVFDGVVLFRRKPFIPLGMRKEILETLHRGHQGTTGMLARLSKECWWPKVTLDVEEVRYGCKTCDLVAPSQPKMPPIQPRLPQYPMQYVSSDYFELDGYQYLVIIERYLVWPVVARATKGNFL